MIDLAKAVYYILYIIINVFLLAVSYILVVLAYIIAAIASLSVFWFILGLILLIGLIL